MTTSDPMRVTPLKNFPPQEEWDHWEEFDAKAWPRKEKKAYSLIPTICFNCEAACGLVGAAIPVRPVRLVRRNTFFRDSKRLLLCGTCGGGGG